LPGEKEFPETNGEGQTTIKIVEPTPRNCPDRKPNTAFPKEKLINGPADDDEKDGTRASDNQRTGMPISSDQGRQKTVSQHHLEATRSPQIQIIDKTSMPQD